MSIVSVSLSLSVCLSVVCGLCFPAVMLSFIWLSLCSWFLQVFAATPALWFCILSFFQWVIYFILEFLWVLSLSGFSCTINIFIESWAILLVQIVWARWCSVSLDSLSSEFDFLYCLTSCFGICIRVLLLHCTQVLDLCRARHKPPQVGTETSWRI